MTESTASRAACGGIPSGDSTSAADTIAARAPARTHTVAARLVTPAISSLLEGEIIYGGRAPASDGIAGSAHGRRRRTPAGCESHSDGERLTANARRGCAACVP